MVIDELDRQQQEILGHLVRTNETDILTTLRNLHANLGLYRFCTKPQYKGVSDIFSSYVEELSTFVETHNLYYSFDLDERTIEKDKDILLFSDKLTTHHTSLKKRLCVGFDQNLGQHMITTYGDNEHLQDEKNFPQFLGALDQLVNRRFYSVIRQAEECYRENLEALQLPVSQHGSIFSVVSPTQAIASILDQMNLHHLRRQLGQQLIHLVGHQRSDRKSAANFHTRGVRMIEIDRLPEAMDSVVFYHHGYHVSPTGMLASWVEAGCYVLGVSATAECESVLHNFDIRYLRDSLGYRYRGLSEQQRQTVHDYYAHERDYKGKGVTIIAEPQRADMVYVKELLLQWQSRARNVDLLLGQLLEEETVKSFHYQWVSKLCRGIERFVHQPDNRYMLAMLNRSLKQGIANFLQWFVDNLAASTNSPVKLVSNINADFLKKGAFELAVIAHLEQQPGKLIGITTYQTMASGKNPDYTFNPALERGSLRHVGYRSADKTDIDSLYLESPTNMINISGEPDDKISDRLLLLSYGMAMQEAGLLTPGQAQRWSRDVVHGVPSFKLCNELKRKYYHQTEDWLTGVYRLLEQAVGRTARTEMKRQQIMLLFDEDLTDLLVKDSRNESLFSHEYKALVHCAKAIREGEGETPVDKELRRLKNRAVLNTGRSHGIIDRMLNVIAKGCDGVTAQSWLRLREMLLQEPALIEPPVYGEYYLKSPEQGGYDFWQPEEALDFNQYQFFHGRGRGAQRVSAQEAKLPVLAQNYIVAKHFRDNRYALTWPDSAHYILTPPMFINIYKGALGEEVGEAILSHYSFTLEPMPLQYFEQFDAKLVFSGREAWIDFKFWDLERWRSLSDELRKEVMCKFVGKVRRMGLSRMVVCNAIGSADDAIGYFDKNFKPLGQGDYHSAAIVTIPALIDECSAEVNEAAVQALMVWLSGVENT